MLKEIICPQCKCSWSTDFSCDHPYTMHPICKQRRKQFNIYMDDLYNIDYLPDFKPVDFHISFDKDRGNNMICIKCKTEFVVLGARLPEWEVISCPDCGHADTVKDYYMKYDKAVKKILDKLKLTDGF